MSPFLDPVTAAKVIFVTPTNPQDMAKLHAIFDARLLETRVGGEFDFHWDFDTYWEHVTALPERLPTAPPLPEPLDS